MAKQKVDAVAQLSNSKERDRLYNKLDEFQKKYYEAIMNKSVVCVDALSGSGKTTVAVLAGLELLAQGKVSKIVYLRFPDDRSLKLGYLPGELEDKQYYYMLPFYEAAEECGLQEEAIDELISLGMIELSTDLGMRGRNLKHTFLVLDECQNGRLPDIKLVLTRLHDNGKSVIIGNKIQCDNYKGDDNAFHRCIEHMCKKPWAVQCELPRNYRGEISKWADLL